MPYAVFCCVVLCHVLQKRDAEQQAHDQLVAQNQVLERDYQRFEKKQKLEKSIQVDGRQGGGAQGHVLQCHFLAYRGSCYTCRMCGRGRAGVQGSTRSSHGRLEVGDDPSWCAREAGVLGEGCQRGGQTTMAGVRARDYQRFERKFKLEKSIQGGGCRGLLCFWLFLAFCESCSQPAHLSDVGAGGGGCAEAAVTATLVCAEADVPREGWWGGAGAAVAGARAPTWRGL